MILSRRARLLIFVLCVAALPASTALAGRKAASRPSVSSLTPPALRVGETLTIRGRNFLPGKKRNSVVFKRDGAPEVTVKVARATRTRMRVVVPSALAKQLAVAGGVAKPARFRVRVVAGRTTSKGFTALKRSPVIVPPSRSVDDGTEELETPEDGCDTDGVVEDVTGDDDVLGSGGQPTGPDPCAPTPGTTTPATTASSDRHAPEPAIAEQVRELALPERAHRRAGVRRPHPAAGRSGRRRGRSCAA